MSSKMFFSNFSLSFSENIIRAIKAQESFEHMHVYHHYNINFFKSVVMKVLMHTLNFIFE